MLEKEIQKYECLATRKIFFKCFRKKFFHIPETYVIHEA